MGLFNRKKQKPPEEPQKTVQAGAAAQGNDAYNKGDYTAAVAYYKKAVAEGDPAGSNSLGVCYFYGKGVEKDITKALELYNRSAEAGWAAAQINLAVLYKNGEYVERDAEKMIYWYEKAAEQGHQRGQFGLAECYNHGNGISQNYEKALYWYEKAAAQGHIHSQREAADLYTGVYDNKLRDIKKAAYWYEKAAEQGDAFSQYALGDHYLKGEGVKQDFKKAEHWLSLSAGQGNRFGQFSLANLYEKEGNGKQYIYWLTKAAEQELGDAQCNLGVEYVTGKHVEKDLAKALYWMEQAKKNDIPQAAGAIEEIKQMMDDERREKNLREHDADRLFSIGSDYYHKNDYEAAFPYIEKAAQMGLPGAQAMLGAWYCKGLDEQGHDCDADLEKAQYWMEKAVQGNVPNAKNALRDIIKVRAADDYNAGIHKIKDRITNRYFGTAVEDFTEAAPYLERAGEIGLVEAQILLASHYLYGQSDCIARLSSGNPDNMIGRHENIDTKKGMYWLKKAAINEDPNSMFIYAKCLLFGPEKLDSVTEVLLESGTIDGSSYTDTEEAFDYAVKASDLGCSKAAGWLFKAEKNHFPGASEALRRTKSYQEPEEKGDDMERLLQSLRS